MPAISRIFFYKLFRGHIDISPRHAIFLDWSHPLERFIGKRRIENLEIYGFYFFMLTINNMDSKAARVKRVTDRILRKDKRGR